MVSKAVWGLDILLNEHINIKCYYPNKELIFFGQGNYNVQI